MIRIVQIVERVVLRSRRKRMARIRAEAARLVADFGLGAHSEARRRERDANDLETAQLWTRVALALARRRGARPDGFAGARTARDAEVIRFLESYWPQPSSQPAELSQLEVLRRIASDPSAMTETL
jgi:hypothetical protein